MGPDSIPARVLKLCAMELSPVLYSLMHESYSTARWPTLWKKSTIIPLPKKPRPSELNHYRPVALTPIASKCYEKLILHNILSTVNPQLDKHQFAYKARRGTGMLLYVSFIPSFNIWKYLVTLLQFFLWT